MFTAKSPCATTCGKASKLLRAAEKYNRIAQHGTNSRSGQAIIEGVQKMRDGLIGDVYLSRGLCYKWRNTIGHAPVEPVPAGVHYDLWTGPAPLKPFTKNRFHYNWHWVWDTGNGDFGNQGIHELDLARWGLGVKYPTRVAAIGAHVMFEDDQTTPNVLNVAYEFTMPDGKKRLLEFEVRHWITNHEAEIGTPAFGGGEVPAALGNAKEAKTEGGTAEHHWQHFLRLQRICGHERLRQLQVVARGRAGTRAPRQRRRQQLGEFHRLRPQPQEGKPERAHRGRPDVLHAPAPRATPRIGWAAPCSLIRRTRK